MSSVAVSDLAFNFDADPDRDPTFCSDVDPDPA